MSVLIYPDCPSDCGGALPAVSFDDCAPAIHYGEVSKLYLANVEAADFTNVELLSEWTTRLTADGTNPDAIRELTVIGDLPEAERTEIAISGDRTIAGVKNFTMNFEIDETNVTNYNFLLTTECNLKFKMWFETSDGILYGGNEGIEASILMNLVIPRERTDVVKYMGQAKWRSQFSPLRSTMPTA